MAATTGCDISMSYRAHIAPFLRLGLLAITVFASFNLRV
jgi:hypothetical protein